MRFGILDLITHGALYPMVCGIGRVYVVPTVVGNASVVEGGVNCFSANAAGMVVDSRAYAGSGIFQILTVGILYLGVGE